MKREALQETVLTLKIIIISDTTHTEHTAALCGCIYVWRRAKEIKRDENDNNEDLIDLAGKIERKTARRSAKKRVCIKEVKNFFFTL